ncbi:MBL fold metallo-hydrolase [Thalassobacillus sp. CUG 92003]|uniref:MBL fold metallo-hydrolase n=1 Tax=Thalassobacillus sp. CUG 92003 TaxID=2736641 RepID=UPI0015E67C2E|nr:MBL fold metallo-hydrolase [Thalassobacillus sp. CUG 92003]
MATHAPIHHVGDRMRLIDGFDLGYPGRTGTYVLMEEALTLIETGPSPSIPYVLDGLHSLGIDPADIQYIIVTHIHLDHAGGAGLLLQECPNATVVVHPRGKRHLADPSRLIAGARAVYGDTFGELFDPILPIPEKRLLTKEDGDTLELSSACTLRFLDTPGHANHHYSIYDPVSNGIFSGDTAGIRYHQTQDYGLTFYLPSTSPNQFNPDEMIASIERLRNLNLDRIYFGHFGESQDPEIVYTQVTQWLPHFIEAGKQALANNEGTAGIQRRLLDHITGYLEQYNIPDNHSVYDILKLDCDVCAMGIADYLAKK